MVLKLLTGLVVIILSFECYSSGYRVFYIPFDVQTDIPIHFELIEKQAHKQFDIKQSKEIDQLFLRADKEYRNSRLSIDESIVDIRLKIKRISDGRSIFYDRFRQEIFQMKYIEESQVSKDVLQLISKRVFRDFFWKAIIMDDSLSP